MFFFKGSPEGFSLFQAEAAFVFDVSLEQKLFFLGGVLGSQRLFFFLVYKTEQNHSSCSLAITLEKEHQSFFFEESKAFETPG